MMTRQMLGSAYDKEEEGEIVDTDNPSPRPKDAATLMLIRRDQAAPRVLMGKRAGTNAFMPDKYVFPGGRVDPPDGRAPALTELDDETAAKLAVNCRRSPRAFALTAIRETFEETGLIVGKPGEIGTKPPEGWADFYAQGVAPCLNGFTFLGRAVTPPYRPKRYDARFFYGLAEELLIDERPPIDGAELSDLHWVTLSDAMALDLPSVTRFMLGEIEEHLTQPERAGGPAYLRWTRGGHKMERL